MFRRIRGPWAARAVAVLAAACFIGIAPVRAQVVKEAAPTYEQMLASVRTYADQLLNNDAALRTLLTKAYGDNLDDARFAIAAANLRRLMGDPKFQAYAASRLMTLVRAGVSSKEAGPAMLQAVISLQAKGLLRLPAEQRELFMQHLVAALHSVSPSTCKALLMNKVDAENAARIERHYMMSLTPERFNAVMSMYIDAAMAELKGFPDTPLLTIDEAALAEKVYNGLVRKRLAETVDKETLAHYSSEKENADPAAVCTVLLAAFEAMFDMDEPYKTWQYTRFLKKMQ